MAEYKYEFVNVRIRDGIAWTALNRPEKRNAMSPQLHYDMDDALRRLETDDDVKVVVVTGEGGNFSAGQDLQKFFRELERNPGREEEGGRRRQPLALGAASINTTSRPSPWCTASASAARSCSFWPAISPSPPRTPRSRSPR